VRKKRPWMLRRDNALAHDDALSVKQFLVKNRTPVLRHNPVVRQISRLRVTFSAICKIRKRIEGNTRFESVETVRTKSTWDIARKGFPPTLWKIRTERCIERERDVNI